MLPLLMRYFVDMTEKFRPRVIESDLYFCTDSQLTLLKRCLVRALVR